MSFLHSLSCRHALRTRPISSFLRGSRRPLLDVSPRSIRRVHLPSNNAPGPEPSLPIHEPTFAVQFPKPPLGRPVLFSLGVSALVFGFAAYQTNKETDYWKSKATTGPLWRIGPPSSEDLLRAERLSTAGRFSDTLAKLQQIIAPLPQEAKTFVNRIYITLGEKWLNMSEGRRVCYAIGGVNTLVFIAWAIPQLRPFMSRSFTHGPLSGKSYTLFTSMFSHQSFLHLLFNSVALTGFGASALVHLRREQLAQGHLPESTSQYHFLAFYITAGLFASMLSHVVATRVRLPRLVAALSHGPSANLKTVSNAQYGFLPSLGASGAIYSTLAITALAFPQAEVAIIFLPMFPIPIAWGMTGIVCMDILGILRGWRMFDHWAHFGGALFGGMYYYLGPPLWDSLRLSLTASPSAPKPA